VPNAQVYLPDGLSVWWGDLDLWRDADRLEKASKIIGARLYVLRELSIPAARGTNDVVGQAVWHTGGRVTVDHRLIRESGLTPNDLQVLLGVSRFRLTHRQLPYVALQINARLKAFNDYLGPLTRYDGHPTWGHWIRSRNELLENRSPYDVLRSGGSFVIPTLFPRVFQNQSLVEPLWPAMMAGLQVTMSSRIRTQWPIVERPTRATLEIASAGRAISK